MSRGTRLLGKPAILQFEPRCPFAGGGGGGEASRRWGWPRKIVDLVIVEFVGGRIAIRGPPRLSLSFVSRFRPPVLLPICFRRCDWKRRSSAVIIKAEIRSRFWNVVDKFQVVKFNNYLSSKFLVRSGVPRGSHLGPLLFNLFINDVTDVFEYSKFLLYADEFFVKL